MAKRADVYRNLRDMGMTYEQIGAVFGVSKQAVHDSLKRKGDCFHESAVRKIKYIGLRNWMLENRITLTELMRRCGVRRIPTLSSESNYNPTKKNIDAILRVTGLTYEECFREEDIL